MTAEFARTSKVTWADVVVGQERTCERDDCRTEVGRAEQYQTGCRKQAARSDSASRVGLCKKQTVRHESQQPESGRLGRQINRSGWIDAEEGHRTCSKWGHGRPNPDFATAGTEKEAVVTHRRIGIATARIRIAGSSAAIGRNPTWPN